MSVIYQHRPIRKHENGREMKKARQFAAQHDLIGRVTFHGWLETSDVATLIASCRAMVFPSLLA